VFISTLQVSLSSRYIGYHAIFLSA
jgi:hypothetical protein